MPKEVLHTILAKYRVRYKNAVDKKHKGTILTEFCETFEYSRKHAMALLGKPPGKVSGGSGPPVKYGPSVVIHLRNL